MISHFHFGIDDFPRSFAFYISVLDELGLVLKFRDPEGRWAGWTERGSDRPMLIIGLPFDHRPANPGNGQMIALNAASREIVDRCHAVAVEGGGTSEGAPGLRPHYHPYYYGAYFRDIEGNKLCVVCHVPVSA